MINLIFGMKTGQFEPKKLINGLMNIKTGITLKKKIVNFPMLFFLIKRKTSKFHNLAII